MKALLVTIVVVSAAVAGVVYFSGITDFDPAADASAFREQVKPGQTWPEVLDVREPGKYAWLSSDPAHRSGRTVAIKFRADDFRNLMSTSPPAEGFVFEYTFGAGQTLEVVFGADGKVESVEGAVATPDLHQGNASGL
jgi:hypothetical protein